MCPSFRVTRDEQHLTRGRANTLRLALTGQLGPAAMASDAVAAAMALCVSCKACKRECPTGIDMAKMKIEVLSARVAARGLSLRDRLVAYLPRYAPYAAALAPVSNLRNRFSLLRRLGERFPGFAATRKLPEFRGDYFRDDEAGDAAPENPRGEVFLLADTFNRYFEPENLRAAVKILGAAGYRVRVPVADGRPLCCGRTFLSAGLVDQARAEAGRTRAALADDIPVIGLEPSCLLTLRDEFLSLLPGPASKRLAGRAFLLAEFLAREKIDLPFKSIAATAHVHGHCHQKAFGAFPDTLSVLGRIPDLRVTPITSSCCGMAGSFGYQAETQEASRAMAEASLLPAVRAADTGEIIVADGTSCRHQIADLAGRRAVHSVQLLARALA